MFPQPIEQQILDQVNRKVQFAMSSCSKQILTALKESFHSLNHLHQQRESEKDKIISQQKNTIDRLNKINDFMEGFAENYINYKNSSSEPRKDNSKTQLFSEIQKKNVVDQKLKEKQLMIPLRNQILEERQNQILRHKKRVQTKNIQKINKSNSQKKVKQRQTSKVRRKKLMQKEKDNERRRKYMRRKIDDCEERQKIIKNSSKQKDKHIKKDDFKSPLQCLSSHPLSEVSYTPNFTRLKFIQYQHKRQTVFNEYEVQIISKHDLKNVTAFAFSTREVTNQVLSLFTKLELVNLRSLRIQNNQITDLKPLRNLNLKILQDLDVSNNPLNIQSAYLLAMQNFDELIYFTVSFNTGLDSQYWKILLENQMQNYPKLQALDVCNQNQLSAQTKKSIEHCMLRKSAFQKHQSDQSGHPDYPENYQIKINWIESLDIFATYPQEKQRQIGTIWQKAVNYERITLQRLFARKIKRQFQEKKNKTKNLKRKGIKKTRGRRGSSRTKVRKMDEKNQESQSIDQSIESEEKIDSEQERSSG